MMIQDSVLMRQHVCFRTKVYSGVKSGKSWASAPSLYDICVRVLQENIDGE